MALCRMCSLTADGFKEGRFPRTGPGNYLTMSKSIHSAMQILAKMRSSSASFYPRPTASSTPAHRVTESELFAGPVVRGPLVFHDLPLTAVRLTSGTPWPAAQRRPAYPPRLGNVSNTNCCPAIKTIDAVGR